MTLTSARHVHLSLSVQVWHMWSWSGPYIYIYSVYTVFLAGKLRNIRSYTVYINGSGQPRACASQSSVPKAL